MPAPKDLSKRLLVEIVWWDAYSVEGWGKPDELMQRAEDGCRCTTVGYLLAQDDQRISVIQSTSDGTKGGGLFVIPLGRVIETHVLKRRKH